MTEEKKYNDRIGYVEFDHTLQDENPAAIKAMYEEFETVKEETVDGIMGKTTLKCTCRHFAKLNRGQRVPQYVAMITEIVNAKEALRGFKFEWSDSRSYAAGNKNPMDIKFD